ncbi:alpha-glucosidase [Halogeometricum sp. S1BR25-6]|uniref:Alpha-glucosidase n=1 Tax=Halogeometricum salsisoli TaxID=2950536 RepID=A0ABU2GH75_9EURY|nr:alpha-glucosidase [Halogeometricum sp. S1BR25-6]MDS0300151.1 alpha-glucosidase [Halogeometricum sp. S1BR25-6]
MSSPETEPALDRAWWKEAVVYQIYPKSFNDSDGDVRRTDGSASQPGTRRISGDGVGDIPGIIDRVDYLDELGVDAVWLCPVYESPQADNGYDISDYRSIADIYGDLDDWEALLDALHARDIRLVMDLVVNHTSDEHEWFRKSRRREGAYEDYYIWRDGDTDEEGDPTPPNNWESVFGGPAWTYDEERGQWYLHLFDEKQPDLDWRNPDVREAVYEMMEWWLEKGIDGFRMDVINLVSKAEGLPDGDPDAGLTGAEHFFNGPNVHEYLGEMCDEVLSDDDLLTIGETPGADVEDARQYVAPDGDGLSMVFQFEHVTFDHDEHKWDAGDWSLVEFKRTLAKWQTGLADDGWNSVYLNNHDQPRMVSRFGDAGDRDSSAHRTRSDDDEGYRRKSAKLLGTLTHTLHGTPFVYQGEEIGMTNASFASPDELRDVEALNFVEEAIEAGRADSYDDVRDAVEYVARDNARTPMQWSDVPNAGFTDEDADPWLKCNANYETVNVEAARADEDSVFNYYRDLIDLRHDRDVLVYGEFDLLRPEDPDVFAYTRTLGDERGLVVLNFAATPVEFATPERLSVGGLELAISNAEAPTAPPETLELGPYEARVYLTS